MPIKPFINAVKKNAKILFDKNLTTEAKAKQMGTSVTNLNNSRKYALYLAAYWALNRPDAIVGYIPLYTVQNYEVSRSHDILKYRAIRGEFMAHQKGGNIALRIDFTLQNDIYQAATLVALQIAHLQGVEDIESYDIDNTAIIPQLATPASIPNVTNIDLIKQKAQLKNSNAIPTSSDNSKLYDINDYSFMEGKTHKTMVIFLKDEVLFDMYIETLIYSRNTKEGAGIINGSMLLRHYVPPPIPTKVKLVDITTPGLSREKENTGKYTYFATETQTLKWDVEFEAQDETTANFNIAINSAHRAIMATADYTAKPLELSRSDTNRMTERFITVTKPLTSLFATNKEIKTFSANLKAQLYPFSLSKAYQSATAPYLTVTNIIGDFSRYAVVNDTTLTLNDGTKLHKVYKAVVETLLEPSQLSITYNNGSKDCRCILGWDLKKLTVNDSDGITKEQPLYSGNNYSLVLGSARNILLLFEYNDNGLIISRLST